MMQLQRCNTVLVLLGFCLLFGCRAVAQGKTQFSGAGLERGLSGSSVDVKSLEAEPFVPFGPPLPVEMEKLTDATVTWLERDIVEFVNDRSISPTYPSGVVVRLAPKEGFRRYVDPAQLQSYVDASIIRSLWTTRGIRIGETKRVYRIAGSVTIEAGAVLRWDYSKPCPTLNKNGSPAPPVGCEGGTYNIAPSMPEHPCFWRQIGHYPSSINFNFPLPDMLVIEQCLVSAGVKPNEAFDSTKESIALSDREGAIRRERLDRE
jgi:hypothetical protein